MKSIGYSCLAVLFLSALLNMHVYADTYEKTGQIIGVHHCDAGNYESFHIDIGDGYWYMIYHSMATTVGNDEKAIDLMMQAFLFNKTVILSIDDTYQGTYCNQPKRSYGVVNFRIE